MKKILFSAVLIMFCTINWCFAQGRFSATVTNNGNVLTFKLKPNVTTTTGFAVIEFFIRYPEGSPEFTYGPVAVNTTNFPNLGSWVIERDNPANKEAGFHVDHFIYTAPSPPTTPRAYTGGTEYDVFSVQGISATKATINFQFIHQNTENLYYLAIASETGNDLRSATPNTFFYPATLTLSGPAGSTFYYMGGVIVLPVKLLSFTSAINGCNVNLSWQVTGESNFAYYAIERSENATSFAEIGRIEPSSNNSPLKPYNFIDNSAAKGTAFYRLRLVDKDGRYEFSSVKSVTLNCTGNNKVLVYPTLSDGTVNIKLPPGLNNARIQVVNSIGEVVIIDESKRLNRTIMLKNLANGIYTVRVSHGNRATENVKIVLQR